MATLASLNNRKAESEKRLQAVAARIAAKAGIEDFAIPTWDRDPVMLSILQMDAVSDLLETLEGGKPKTAPAPVDSENGSGATEEPDAGDAAETQETPAVDDPGAPEAHPGKSAAKGTGKQR